MPRYWFTLLIATCLFVGCKESPPLERSSAANRKTSDADLKKDAKGEGEKKKKPDADIAKVGDNSSEEDTLEYPQLTFNGRGYTTYKLKDRLAMTLGIETRLDKTELTIETKTARVDCGNKSGCKQKDVDASVNANSIGANTYYRSSAGELKNLKKDGFNVATYAIYAKSVKGRNGITFTFDKPIPVYPWPAAMSRYSALDRGSETWTTKVTADRHIPLTSNISLDEATRNGEVHERAGNARKIFTISMVVSKQPGTTNNEIKLTFDFTINEDRDRLAYNYFPIPKTSTFTIDTQKRDIISANMVNWSHGDKSERAEESVLDYMLCSKTTSGVVKRFSCN